MALMMPTRTYNGATPICRCRVLYMGSAVPHITKDGLQGIQEPLKELYPEQGAFGARGIDSWLSVWSNGLLLENVDENHKKITRFFPIETLHFCAAVRYVLVPEKNNPATPRFLPLDSPFAHNPDPHHPPLFASILRRTTGIKVLECHAFICKGEGAANALVRCCFHAYADSAYAKQIDERSSVYGTLRPDTDTIDRVEGWRRKNTNKSGSSLTLNSQNGGENATLRSEQQMTLRDDISIYNGDENHKVWAGMSADGTYRPSEYNSTLRSEKASRPRQAMPPAPPPPPPLREEKKKSKNEQRSMPPMRNALSVNNLNMRSNEMRSQPPHSMYNNGNGTLVRGPPHQAIYNNGTLVRGPNRVPMGTPIMLDIPPPRYNNGTLVRGPHPSHPIYNGTLMRPTPVFRPYPSTLPHPGSRKKGKQHAGTFSHRDHQNMGPPFVPIPPPPHLAPNPAMLLPFAPNTNGKKKNKGKMKNRALVPIPMPPHMIANGGMYMVPPQPYTNGHPPISAEIPLSQTQNGEDLDLVPTHENEDESPFNTGIYRKKGHLNERAFSYSIRQEHRSRSYGSLANLQFSTPIPNGNGPSPAPNQDNRSQTYGSLENIRAVPPVRNGTGSGRGKVDAKKEREIMQMMQDLDISGDELERSEVPKAVYESKRLAAVNANAAKLRR